MTIDLLDDHQLRLAAVAHIEPADGIAAILGDTVGLDADATLATLQAHADASETHHRDDLALLAVRVPPN